MQYALQSIAKSILKFLHVPYAVNKTDSYDDFIIGIGFKFDNRLL